MTMMMQLKLTILVVCLATFAGMGVALKIQSDKIKAEKIRSADLDARLTSAVEQHDALVDEHNRQAQVVAEANQQARQREADYARINTRLRRVLEQQAKDWANLPVPPAVDVLLPQVSPLPQDGTGQDPGGQPRPDAPAVPLRS